MEGDGAIEDERSSEKFGLVPSPPEPLLRRDDKEALLSEAARRCVWE